jgi:DNA-binding NarL/FixJ family response regulator
MSQIRILLVDDHEVVRLGMKALLERHPNFKVVAEAATEEEAVSQAISHTPDVIVMDIRLAQGSGIEACAIIKRKMPATKVIMLTSYAEDELLFSAIRAGASGYVLKQIGSTDLVRTIEGAARGESMLDPTLTERVFSEMRLAMQEKEQTAFAELSQQETQVLRHIMQGETNKLPKP